MTSTFIPDFSPDFLDKNPPRPDNEKQIFLFPPYTRTGTVTFFNWLGADVSGYDGYDGVEDKGHTPGVRAKVFYKIDDSQVVDSVNRPYTFHGKNASKSPDKVFISDEKYIPDLFKHTYNDRKRWEACWRGFYSKGSKKWWQYFNAHVYNSTDTLYPFATKGISFRVRVPGNDDEVIAGGVGDGDNYGNHVQINRAWGLWRDLNGMYYIIQMYPHGDNRYFCSGSYSEETDENGIAEPDPDGDGKKPRPKEGLPSTQKAYPDRIDNELREWWGDRYFSLDKNPDKSSGNLPIEKTDDMLQKNIIGKGKEKGVTLYTLEKQVEHLFFCGFSMEFHHDRSAGSKRNHSYLISRLTPIPFYSPRNDSRTLAVLGEPTPMEDLKKGYRKIHFWDPPKEYDNWQDNLDYDDTEPPKDSDTINGDGDTIAIEAAGVFVNEEGEPAPIPASVFLNEDGQLIINSKGEIVTTDDSTVTEPTRLAQYQANEPTNEPD